MVERFIRNSILGSRRTSFVLVLLLVILSGCGSGEEAKNASKNTNTPQNISQNGDVASGETSILRSETGNANGAQDSNINPLVIAKNKRIEMMRKAGEESKKDRPDLETLLRNSSRPGPENSEFAVVLTDVVFERRTFKSHPILTKVEKITEGEKKTIKVYLKDGKIVDLEGNAIEHLAIAQSAAILKAAGIASPTTSLKESKADPK